MNIKEIKNRFNTNIKYKNIRITQIMVKTKENGEVIKTDDITDEKIRSGEWDFIYLYIDIAKGSRIYTILHEVDLSSGEILTNVSKLKLFKKEYLLIARGSNSNKIYAYEELVKDNEEISFINYYGQRIYILPKSKQPITYHKIPIVKIDNKIIERKELYNPHKDRGIKAIDEIYDIKTLPTVDLLPEFNECAFIKNKLNVSLFSKNGELQNVLIEKDIIAYDLSTKKESIDMGNESIFNVERYVCKNENGSLPNDFIFKGDFDLDFKIIEFNSGYGYTVKIINEKISE